MESEANRNLKTYLISALLFAASLAAYLLTISPSLSAYGDSGELVTAATLPGLAHPPGYPLYTVMGWIFSHLPVGDPALRVNMMSAVFSSFAVVLIFLAGRLVFGSEVLAAGVALLCGFSRDFWRLSLSAEVFSLHMLFVTLLLYLLLLIRRKSLNGESAVPIFLLFSFAAGLSLSHHHTIVLLLPAFACLIMTEHIHKALSLRKSLLPAALFLILGLIPYLYLPLGAAHDPPLNWGNPSTLQGFVRMVTRAGYGTFSLGAESGSGWTLRSLGAEELWYMKTLAAQFTVAGFIAGLCGILVLWFRDRKWLLFWAMILLPYGFGFVAMARFPYGDGFMAILERFLLPSYLAFAFLIGYASDYLCHRFRSGHVCAAILLLPLLLAWSNYASVDRHANYMARDYGRNLLKPLDEGAILFVTGDAPFSSLLYCQNVEKLRGDVTVLNEGLLRSEWYVRQVAARSPGLSLLKECRGGDLMTIIRNVIGKADLDRPIYFNHPLDDPQVRLVCTGLAYKVVTAGERDIRADCEALQRVLEKEYQFTGDYGKIPDYFSREILQLYALAHIMLSQTWMDIDEQSHAEASLDRACAFSAVSPPMLFRIGSQYMEMGCWDKALASFKGCINAGGEKSDIFMNLAIIYSRRGETEHVRQSLRKMNELKKHGL